MKEVYLDGKRVRLDPQKAIGKGGEADVYDIGGRALKIFKTPDHPDLAGQPTEQAGAKARLKLHQSKLPQFPKQLPGRVIAPEKLATDKAGKIAGYSMRLIGGAEVLMRFAERKFHDQGLDANRVVQTFLDLHPTLTSLHQRGVIIGDFNDLNVLVEKQQAYLIDADSFAFGSFPCTVFTPKFTDPLLLQAAASCLQLVKPPGNDSDWYAYAVMLMQSLLCVDPFGGVYRPKDAKRRMPEALRPLQRITVFNPEVRYPKPAFAYGILPDELLEQFRLTFEQDERGVFPRRLLENLRWTNCGNCGAQHARSVCPECRAAGLVKETITIRGNVTAHRIFVPDGRIVATSLQHGQLLYLYHEGGQFKREGGRMVAAGQLDPRMRFRLHGPQTIMATPEGKAVVFTPNQPEQVLAVEQAGHRPAIDAGEAGYYWASAGQLYKNGRFGQEYLGDVLAGQTQFWVGPSFGYGFYRAGEVSRAFVFDAAHRGINDGLDPPRITGKLLGATAKFSSQWCWLLLAVQEGGTTKHQCLAIGRDGHVAATAEAKAEDGSWLGTMGGQTAAGDFLLSPTDDGVVRVEMSGGRLTVTREFPDTEPFVSAASRLFASADGLYVVDANQIRILRIK